MKWGQRPARKNKSSDKSKGNRRYRSQMNLKKKSPEKKEITVTEEDRGLKNAGYRNQARASKRIRSVYS